MRRGTSFNEIEINKKLLILLYISLLNLKAV